MWPPTRAWPFFNHQGNRECGQRLRYFFRNPTSRSRPMTDTAFMSPNAFQAILSENGYGSNVQSLGTTSAIMPGHSFESPTFGATCQHPVGSTVLNHHQEGEERWTHAVLIRMEIIQLR